MHHEEQKQSIDKSENVAAAPGGTGSAPPDYHTEKFIKKRDEFKKIYKGMNTSIKNFFNAMYSEGLDID